MENIRVMVVDNDPNDEIITMKALQLNNIGGRIIKAPDGVTALEYLIQGREIPECEGQHVPALLLLDLNMPGMSGMEVLTRLRAEERTTSLPVVIMSSSTDHQEIRACFAAGADGYLHKSVSFDEFVKNMGEIVSQCIKGCTAASQGASGQCCPDIADVGACASLSLLESGIDTCGDYG